MRVLFVDDDPHVGRAYRRALRAHDVEVVTDAREAHARIAAGERFDVIVSDLMMPGMTGVQLHAALLEVAPEQAERMIFVTAGAVSAQMKVLLDATAREVLTKPVPIADLEAAIERAATRA